MAKTTKSAPLNKKNDTKTAVKTPFKLTKQHKIVWVIVVTVRVRRHNVHSPS